jgi:Sulfotransferase domain
MQSKGINDTVFAFGTSHNVSRQGGGHFGYLVLKKDNTIHGYKHDNEDTWNFDEKGNLCFFSKTKEITSRFRYIENENCYIGNIENCKQTVYLLPVISCPENSTTNIQKPSVFINTVPKSGTYLLEAAFKKVGYKATNIMLIGRNIVSDLRNIPEQNFFKQPWRTTLKFPHNIMMPLFNNNVVTGHIEYLNLLDEMRRDNMRVVTLVRDLRDVLLSLYKFKRDTFDTRLEEGNWKLSSEPERFKKFTDYYHDKDLEHIRSIVHTTLLDSNKILLLYENCVKGIVPKKEKRHLDVWSPNLGEQIEQALKDVANKKTATLTTSRSNWRTDWNDSFENYYQSSGMANLNKLLGYV